MYVVEKYTKDKKDLWDELIRNSINGHFMFMRDYMEYHENRFTDHSLMIYFDGRLVAVLPANIIGNHFYSHQGLTFGGLVSLKSITQSKNCLIFKSVIEYIKKSQKVERFFYKCMPDIYSKTGSQENIYSLFRTNFNLYRRDVSHTIDLQRPFSYSKGRKWTINKARKLDLKVAETTDLKPYWIMLEAVIESQHGTKPTHTAEEISLLRERFPSNIRCFTVSENEELLAGVVIYETDTVAHTQYMANSSYGRQVGALDLLIDHLIKNIYSTKQYFDFGISTEDSGRHLNDGLAAQKEGFGARAVVHDFYEVCLNG